MYPLLAIHAPIAPAGVAAPLGGLVEVDDGGVAVGLGDVVDFGAVVDVGDVVPVRAPVDVGRALLVVIDGVDPFTVLEVLIDVAVTVGDADPPAGALPQPARTSPAEVKAGSSTLRIVQGLLDDRLPISTR